jgi:hypothetical protein
MQQKKQDSDTASRAALAGGNYPVLRRDVGAVVQQRLHHRKMPALGGCVQAGPLLLESRRAVSGGATATRAASPGGDALPRGAPCTPHRTLLPRQSHTDSHDCVLTSPCILWLAQTWRAGTRARRHAHASATPACRLTWFLSFTSAPSLIRSATSSSMPFSAA